MISAETAGAIWRCYREIRTAGKLLADMAEAREKYPDNPHAERLRDAFGRYRDLQLGVPSGQDCHRLFDISPLLAESVIRAHIAAKQAELASLNERARIKLDLAESSPESGDVV